MSAPDPPRLGPAPSDPPPELPASFSATLLLTPFGATQLCVAAVQYDWSERAMLVDLYGLEIGYVQFIVIGSRTWVRTDPSAPPQGPVDFGWATPPPRMLLDSGARGIATGPVLGVECDWWASWSTCTNGCEQPGAGCPDRVGSWTWTRARTGAPWRTFFVDRSNPYRLPVIGAFAMLNWASFDEGARPALAAAVSACRGAVDAEPVLSEAAPQDLLTSAGPRPAEAGSIIPGLHLPTGPVTLPTWPDALAVAATTIPTADLNVLPTVVCYDWPRRRMLTRLWDQPGGDYDDLVLTDHVTYDTVYAADGTFLRCGDPEPVGLPRPDWAQHGTVLGVIDGGTPLSPYGTTQLIALPSDRGRTFWVWYTTTADRGVLFTEVPQLCDTGLVLIDYWEFGPVAGFDPGLFDVPVQCTASVPGRVDAAGFLTARS